MGYPVALKIDSQKLVHKSDSGGVVLNIADESQLRLAWQGIFASDSIREVDAEDINGILLQKMASSGREMIIGMTNDPSIGPLLMFGLGGIYVEVLKDVGFKIAPITDAEASELVQGIKGFKLLTGIRGEAASDIKAAEDALLRISQLVTDFDEILEMDINPLFLFEAGKGGIAVDGRIRIDLITPPQSQ